MSRPEEVASYSVFTVLPALAQAWKVSLSKFRVFRKSELVYRQSTRFISLHYSTRKDFRKTEPPTRTASQEHIFHVVGTDPLQAPQQKKQCGEAYKNKVSRILVCPAFFGMPWDLLKLKCAQDLGLGARKKQHRFLDGRMPTDMDATNNGRSPPPPPAPKLREMQGAQECAFRPVARTGNTDVERAVFEWRGRDF